MPWVQLVGMFVGEASKGINVHAPDPSQYQLRSDPALTILTVVVGTAAVGGLLYFALKKPK